MTPQQRRRKNLEDGLKIANDFVWRRDGRCVVCDSKNIAGEPFASGAHHILSRGSHPSLTLDVHNLCLLCVNCHENANTKEFAKKLLGIMQSKYGYNYSDNSEYTEVLNA